MNPQRLVRAVLLWAVCSNCFAQSQSMESELSTLADKLASQIKEQEKKKVAVLDFTDLQSNSSELGRYIAEQLTVNLVIARKNFSILDRANLQRVLAEHKLTAAGIMQIPGSGDVLADDLYLIVAKVEALGLISTAGSNWWCGADYALE